jgi:PIN domain nuclease of toxin-antitoxin system
MRLLVDSHVALWWLDDAPRLGPRCREAIAEATDLFFSPVTPWELGMKRALGKLTFPDALVDELIAGGFVPLPITARHAEFASDLPLHHRDPFDRMLVAHAQLEGLTLVTADDQLHPYGIPLLDART